MRDDMKKVLTERPRTKSWSERRKTSGKIRPVDLDEDLDVPDEPSRAPISARRVYGYDHKEFTDLISPLRRYLAAQVGRPWNDVWSEMCATLDRRSTTGNHVFEHIRWEVETNTAIVDGKVVTFAGMKPVPVDGLYVHPTTGKLSRAPSRYQKWRPKRDENVIAQSQAVFDKRVYLIKIEGIWYEGIYDRHTSKPLLMGLRNDYWRSPYRVIEAHEVADTTEAKHIGNRVIYFPVTKRTVYYVRRSKRQLSRKELRTRGLENDRPETPEKHR